MSASRAGLCEATSGGYLKEDENDDDDVGVEVYEHRTVWLAVLVEGRQATLGPPDHAHAR